MPYKTWWIYLQQKRRSQLKEECPIISEQNGFIFHHNNQSQVRQCLNIIDDETPIGVNSYEKNKEIKRLYINQKDDFNEKENDTSQLKPSHTIFITNENIQKNTYE